LPWSESRAALQPTASNAANPPWRAAKTPYRPPTQRADWGSSLVVISLTKITCPGVRNMTQAAEQSVLDTPVSRSAIAVVDIETTGLHPGADRLIEISVVRVEPGAAPFITLDTLVNPGRKVAATEIHGITDADVSDA